jgi:hypothetical protein
MSHWDSTGLHCVIAYDIGITTKTSNENGSLTLKHQVNILHEDYAVTDLQ